MIGVAGTENISKERTPNGIRYKVFIDTGNRKFKQLGSAKTLSEAIRMRNWCREHNWSKFIGEMTYIQKMPSGKFQIYKDFPSGRELFGTFDTLEEAQRERDLLIKCNWDWDLMVEMI